MSDPTIDEYVMDLRLNLNRLASIVEEVEQNIAVGKLDNALTVLESQTGKMGRFSAAYSGLQQTLREERPDS
jgi:hypothetical protein